MIYLASHKHKSHQVTNGKMYRTDCRSIITSSISTTEEYRQFPYVTYKVQVFFFDLRVFRLNIMLHYIIIAISSAFYEQLLPYDIWAQNPMYLIYLSMSGFSSQINL